MKGGEGGTGWEALARVRVEAKAGEGRGAEGGWKAGCMGRAGDIVKSQDNKLRKQCS